MRPILAGLIAAALHCSALAGSTSANLYGRWKVTGVAGAQNTTSLADTEIDKLKGEDMVVASGEIRFADAVCVHPQMTKSTHATETFFRREYKMSATGLHLPTPVTEYDVSCATPSPISYFYVRDSMNIVIFWNGFFLNATKQVSTTDKR